jgi:DHA1 family inner membrane transport protein
VLFPFASFVMVPALQARLIRLAGGAPNLAAASLHSAFNIANSLGAWLGGLTISAGLGYQSPIVVAAGLAELGLILALISGWFSRNRPRRRLDADRPRRTPPDGGQPTNPSGITSPLTR